MVDPYDEEMRKRALSEWSSSKYAQLEESSLYPERMLTDNEEVDWEVDPDAFFHTRGTPNHIERRVPTSKHWDKDKLTVPTDQHVGNYSRWSLKHGYLVATGKIPDMAANFGTNTRFHLGFELGAMSSYGGYVAFQRFESGGANVDVFRVKTPTGAHYTHVESLLPGDAETADHQYVIKRNRGFAELYVDEDLIAVAVWGAGADINVVNDTEPYAIVMTRGKPPSRLPTLLEASNGSGTERTVEFGVRDYRFASGDPCPPRNYRLHDAGADTLLTSGTYDTGTSHKSHPIPVQGYSAKAFLFRADTDSTSDGLAVEVLTQEGNWRTYLTRTYSANSLELIEPAGEFPLMRLAYEPTADGASITDAEATVR